MDDIDLIGDLAALWTPPPPRAAGVAEIRALLRDQPRCQDVGHEGKKGATQFSNDDGEGCEGAEGGAKGDKPDAKSGSETAQGEDRGDTALNESAQQPNVENQKRPEPGQGLGKWFETHPEEYEEYKRNLAERQRELVEAGQSTDVLHTINPEVDPDHRIYTEERTAQHEVLLDEAEAKLATGVPAERQAVVMGGLPGAGKTTTLRHHSGMVGIDPSNFAEVGADNFKEAIVEHGMVERHPGLPPMEAAELIHQESRRLAARFFDRLIEKGTNIALDSTMSNIAPFIGRQGYIERLRAAGYKVKMVFVDTTPETSLRRVKKRHLLGMDDPHGGRTIPDYAITGPSSRSQKGFNSRSRDSFEELKGLASEWYTFDSNVDGAPPALIDSWDGRHNGGANQRDYSDLTDVIARLLGDA